MFRLAGCFGAHEFVREMVSGSLSAMIEFFLGAPDNNGDFTDIERIRNYMTFSEYLAPLTYKEMVMEEGLLAESKPWTEVIAKRYSDINAKIKDRVHEYTFDEMGEGLVFDMIDVFNDEDARMYFIFNYPDSLPKDLLEYTMPPKASDITRVIMGDIAYDKLRACIQTELISELKDEYKEEFDDIINDDIEKYTGDDGTIYFEDSTLDIFYECNKAGVKLDTFVNCLADAYTDFVCSFSDYLCEGMDENAAVNFIKSMKVKDEDAICPEFIIDKAEYIWGDIICWDYDYEFVLAGLARRSDTNAFLSTEFLRFNMKEYDEIATGKNDMRYNIGADDCDMNDEEDNADDDE